MSDSNAQSQELDFSTVSKGVNYLVDGYIAYAKEVITDRAISNMYDGLKPVHRRVMYTLYNEKSSNYIKSQRVSGDTLIYHPHGDAAVYQAAVLMTDKNGSLAFPLIEGSGSFGQVFKTDPPSAARYTEMKLSLDAKKEYFTDLDGIEMIPNFDSTTTEPSVLPVTFPAALVNSSKGIAVGFKSMMPSFNFVDVCNLVKEYIQNGKCTTVIEPDFVTGGYYIRNEKELAKLMQVGEAKLKLRGRLTEDDKTLVVTEVPFGKTIQGLIRQVNNLKSTAVKNAYDVDDFSKTALFKVDCSSKRAVDDVRYLLYKDTDFQYNFSASITVIKDGKPVTVGVWTLIEEWVKWRKEVLTKALTLRINNTKEAMRESQAFMNLIKATEKKDTFVKIVTTKGRTEGIKYLRENFSRDDIPEDLLSFVASRSITTYHTGGDYASKYAGCVGQLNMLTSSLDDLDGTICKQMDELIKTYGTKMKRRTEVTNKDYIFSEDDGEVTKKEDVVDNTACTYELNNGFITKSRYGIKSDSQFRVKASASATLFTIDSDGRCIRLYCEDIPYTTDSLGTYIPTYGNFTPSDDKNYKLYGLWELKDETLTVLYKDGNMGFVDMSEWLQNNRHVKVIEKGIATGIADKVGAVFEGVPDVLVVSDGKGDIAYARMEYVQKKNRTAKTRVFTMGKLQEIKAYKVLTTSESMLSIARPTTYDTRLRKLQSDGDFRFKMKEMSKVF